MCKINLIPLLILSFLISACGGGGGSSSPKPTSSAVKVSSSSITSSSIASSSIAPSSAPSSAISSAAISSISSSSIYSANVDHLRDLATFPIGVAVSNNDSPSYDVLTNAAEQTVVERHFNQMTAGNIMKVSYLHPNLNTFSFANADAFVDYAKSKDIKVHAHTLIWHSDYQVPNFIKTWGGTADEFLTMLDTHVTTIVDHFEAKNNIVSWDVVNEAIDDNTPANFRTDSPFYTKSGNSAVYIERAFTAAREADAIVDLYYNDYSIEANGPKMDKVIAMLEDFDNRSIPISGIGFQMHVFLTYPSIENISTAMQRVVDLGYKVKISELDVAINNPYSGSWPNNKVSTFTSTSDAALAQKKRYCEIVAAYIATVPEEFRGGITVWGTTDANTWLNDLFKGASQYNGAKIAWPLLFDEQYNDKPALRGFADGLLGTACTNL
jgi:endo-1,4-beta-xylanase